MKIVGKKREWSLGTMIIKLRPKEAAIEGIRWESNEPDVRAFVQNDRNLRFLDRGLEVYNKQTKTWENCPMFSFICRGNTGELFVLTPEQVDNGYDTVE